MSILALIHTLRTRFRSQTHDPLIEVCISRTAILHNLHTYQKQFPTLTFAPVLKSNAYGHGLVPVAHILKNEHVAFFVLDSFYEAVILRKNGIKTPLLVIGYTPTATILNSRLQNVAFTITSLEHLHTIAKETQKVIHLHLKIDTGMHRQGILPEDLDASIALIHTNRNLVIDGICSHFGDADNTDDTYTKKQIGVWETIVKKCTHAFPSLRYTHLAATAGTSYTDAITANVARLGLGLYGINPSPNVSLSLRPALSLHTAISSVRSVQAGESVGYNATYTAEEPRTIATIPVGYAEGVDRRISNSGFVSVGNTTCPIVGRVSMNITSIDVSACASCTIGDSVTVISNNPVEKNSIVSIAKACDTIPWEILVHIPQYLRRTVVD